MYQNNYIVNRNKTQNIYMKQKTKIFDITTMQYKYTNVFEYKLLKKCLPPKNLMAMIK